MDRLLSEQEVIKAVNKHTIPSVEIILSEDITAILKEVSSAEPKWIPVSEGLPEEEKRLYWVCTDTGYQCQCRWTNDIYGLGESDRWGWKIFDIPQYQKVIAWMPLPESFKAESEG